MKRVVYLTNIQVPYRVRFFNGLAKRCDLTVLYETKGHQNRDKDWASSEMPEYHTGLLWKDLRLLKDCDTVIIGCCNSPAQILILVLLYVLGRNCILNLDGEQFLDRGGWKTWCKRCVFSLASGYFVAGEGAARSLKKLAGEKPITTYLFSSLSEKDLCSHQEAAGKTRRDDRILVVGQYFPYKGLDVALQAAAMDPDTQYLFVGMGIRTETFRKENQIPSNVEVIPFLQKRELERLYETCGMLVLPSRQECWGLVVNEAASFGMPVVSTWGSGAAIEFMGEEYPQFLAKPGDPEDLLRCIRRYRSSEDKDRYAAFLLKKSQKYYIEQNIQVHLQALEREESNGFSYHSGLQCRKVPEKMSGQRVGAAGTGFADYFDR